MILGTFLGGILLILVGFFCLWLSLEAVRHSSPMQAFPAQTGLSIIAAISIFVGIGVSFPFIYINIVLLVEWADSVIAPVLNYKLW